ncbi:MAG: molybdopterin biosynthesis protein, partial [Peptococcaceae bacterium]|nr:molybdopterin biosynthesis protein [Peptococcaceae bacterium]
TVSRKLVSPLGVEEFVRVKLGQVGDKVIATPISRGAGILMSLVRADGMVRVPRLSEGYNAGDTAPVELFRSPEEIRETTVITGSHDIALDVLANFLRRKFPMATLSSAHVGSLGGLTALKRGEAHCAGTHLLDEETGEYNVSYNKRLLPGRGVILVNLVYREQGLILAKGNPKNIRGLEDLAREGVRFVNRQRGAGTRVLLDYRLRQLGIDPARIHGYDHEEYTHMAVAAAVKAGAADAGLGIRAAARALDLDFTGIVEERYDLCIPAEYWDTPYIRRLLEVMAMPEFQEEVSKLGGYDLWDCGKIMWRSL